VDKLVRDAMVWTHLAGDNVQRMRTLRKLAGKPVPVVSGD
jgi:hypothetical protein